MATALLTRLWRGELGELSVGAAIQLLVAARTKRSENFILIDLNVNSLKVELDDIRLFESRMLGPDVCCSIYNAIGIIST